VLRLFLLGVNVTVSRSIADVRTLERRLRLKPSAWRLFAYESVPPINFKVIRPGLIHVFREAMNYQLIVTSYSDLE